MNSYDLEKKILSYAQNSIYSYKTLFSHIANLKESKLEGISLKCYIIYINLSIILNLIHEGKLSLAFVHVKYLLSNDFLNNHFNFEIIAIIQNILTYFLEYDVYFTLENNIYYYKISQNQTSGKEISNEHDIFNNKENSINDIKLIKTKLFGLTYEAMFLKNISEQDFKNDEFIKMQFKFIINFSILKNIDSNELKKFIKLAKTIGFHNFYISGKILLAKLKIKEDLNETKLILMKLKEKNLKENQLLKTFLLEGYINLKSKNMKKLKRILSMIKHCNLIKTCGKLEDEFEYFYFKIEYLIFKVNKKFQNFFLIKEIFLIWLYLINISLIMMNKEKTFHLLNLLINDFFIDKELVGKYISYWNDKKSFYFEIDKNNFKRELLNSCLDDFLEEIQSIEAHQILGFLNSENKLNIILLFESHLEDNQKLFSFFGNLISAEEELEIIYLLIQNSKSFIRKINNNIVGILLKR